MIVTARDGRFVLTANDDHARMAGQLAGMLSEAALPEKERREEFVYAVAEHDRAWIGLDEAPIWNDTGDRPFSVADYPMTIRLPHYLKGLEEVGKMSEYAGLLCSMHYTSLPPDALKGAAGGMGPQVFAVVAAVKERERQTMSRLNLLSEANARLLEKHLRLLQMLDRISLWLCMHSFGETLSASNDSYRLMFGGVEDGFNIRWSSQQTARIDPYPWSAPVTLTWKRKELSERRAKEIGLLRAWQESPCLETNIHVLPEGGEPA